MVDVGEELLGVKEEGFVELGQEEGWPDDGRDVEGFVLDGCIEGLLLLG